MVRTSTQTISRIVLTAFLLLSLGGCAGDDSPSAAATERVSPQEPIGVQLTKVVPPLRGQRFLDLLDFESNSDSVFVTAGRTGGVQMVYDHAHTGRRALRFEPGTRKVSIKLAALLGSRPFPGDWTLAGAFLYCDQSISVDVSFENAPGVEPRSVMLSPGRWTMALVDISTAQAHEMSPGNSPTLTFTLPPRPPVVWCDDVMLIDNQQTIVEHASVAIASTEPSTTPAATTPSTVATTMPSDTKSWAIEKRGLSYVGSGPFNFALTTSEAVSSGWQLDEANALRARFHSSGKVKKLTIYSDGRAYWDGALHAMSDAVRTEPAFAEEHESPAEISISEEMGRLIRDSVGDANNDGYNEQRGAYQVQSTGSRIELKLTPRVRSMMQPAFEIHGMPSGKVLITSEGRLVEQSVRLDDGTVLFTLPFRIERTTTVNVRLQ